MSNCSQCGSPIDEGTKFCARCGTAFPVSGEAPPQPPSVEGATTGPSGDGPGLPSSVVETVAHAGDALKRAGVPAGLVERVVGILTNPSQEWDRIAGEATTIQDLYVKYAILLAPIPFIATVVGMTLFFMRLGLMQFMGNFMGDFIVRIAISLVVQLGGLFVLGYVLKTLGPNFGADADLIQCMKVAVYASTPAWLAGVVNILYVVPELFRLANLIVLAGGVYGIYLLWLGVGRLLRPRADQQVVYTVVALVCFVVVMGVATYIGGAGSPYSRAMVTLPYSHGLP